MTATLARSRDLVHYYAPRGTCARIFHERGDEVLIAGPAGTGKSRAAMEKLHMVALLAPGMRGLIVRKTLASLGATALNTWRKFVIKEALANDTVNFYGGSAEEPPQYRYDNGSAIMIGGMDKPLKIMSAEYDLIYAQEATELTVDDWEAMTTRLRNWRISYQQLLADCNPDTPTHWLKLRADAGQVRLLESRHEDNPELFHDDGTLTERGAAYIAKLDALTGARYHRLRKGLWVAAEGIIYDGYDPAVHLADRFDIPPGWTRWWSVDFGYVNPTVVQWWAEDPDGRLWLYRELYHTGRTVDQVAADILACVRDSDGNWSEPRPRAIVCDHDAEGRAVLERELGMSTVAAHKAVTEGIQAVQARLRPAGDGRPRLMLLRDSTMKRDPELVDAKRPTSTVEEIVGYVWDTGAGKAPKEAPLKVDDHGMDAMRYVVAQIDLGARPRMRWLG